MRRSIATSAAGVWLVVLASAAWAADPPPRDKPPEAEKTLAVKEVTLDPTLKHPVCRRYVPTGSRIAKERCESAEATSAGQEAERDQMRRDLAEMRMRQAMREQARGQAFAEAMRRRAGQ